MIWANLEEFQNNKCKIIKRIKWQLKNKVTHTYTYTHIIHTHKHMHIHSLFSGTDPTAEHTNKDRCKVSTSFLTILKLLSFHFCETGYAIPGLSQSSQ